MFVQFDFRLENVVERLLPFVLRNHDLGSLLQTDDSFLGYYICRRYLSFDKSVLKTSSRVPNSVPSYLYKTLVSGRKGIELGEGQGKGYVNKPNLHTLKFYNFCNCLKTYLYNVFQGKSGFATTYARGGMDPVDSVVLHNYNGLNA